MVTLSALVRPTPVPHGHAQSVHELQPPHDAQEAGMPQVWVLQARVSWPLAVQALWLPPHDATLQLRDLV